MLGSEVARLVRVIGELPGVDAASRPRRWPSCWRLPRLPQLPARRPRAPRRDGRRRPRPPSRPRRRPSTRCTRCWRRPAPRPRPGSSRPAARSWPRASRTAPTTGGRGSWRSTRSAATRRGSAAPSRSSTRRSSAAPSASESMTTLSTHDTKRSEDVRARLAVLAELPDEWARLVRGWLARHPLADRPLAHLVWQNLVGAWPLSRERAHAYVEKAAREAGTSTTWTDPTRSSRRSAARARRRRVRRPGDGRGDRRVRRRIAPFGWSNSLSQKLLQLTMPGVPDVYQGTELWDFSLVDPDNRRPVDYALAPEAARRPRRRCGAGGRRDRGGEAARGLPGAAGPPGPPRVVRRVRAGRGDRVRRPSTWSRSTAAAPSRWPPGCRSAWRDGWGDTALQLPNGPWRDLLTGRAVRLRRRRHARSTPSPRGPARPVRAAESATKAPYPGEARRGISHAFRSAGRVRRRHLA